jgi:acetyltransferase-like isoleucine patch superfamily enzyme
LIPRIDKTNITKCNLVLILISTSIKVIRGIIIKPLFKKSKGFLFVGRNASITDKNNIIIGRNVKFESYCEIQGLCKRGLRFGDNVTIGRSTMIRPSSYYGVEIGEGLTVGSNSSIGPLGYVGCGGFIDIGENVMIGPRVSLFAENHNFNSIDNSIKAQGINRKGIKIENNCWIGSGVIILDGVTIGEGSIIGAGTIVTKDVPRFSRVFDRKEKNIESRVKK